MKEWFLRLTLYSLSLVIAIVALEYGLSKFAPNIRLLGPCDIFNKPDEYVGWKGIPNKEGQYICGRVSSYVKINSQGYKDNEHDYKKGKDVFRIVVLGDSMTEAFQYPIEQTFPHILEEKLNSGIDKKEGSKSFEVINLGISGYGTAQEYLTLKHYGLKYEPDLVVLAFFLGNDVANNSLILEREKHRSWETARPFFVLNNGRLEEIHVKANLSNPDKVIEQTQDGVMGPFKVLTAPFAKMFPNIYYSIKDRIPSSKPELLDNSRKHGVLIDNYVYAEEYTPEWQNAWEVTEALILKISDELKEKNIGFRVVVIPNEFEFRPDRLGELPQTTDLRFDLRKPERLLLNFLAGKSIDYVALRPGFEKYSKETGSDLYLHHAYDNHLNANGHAFAAELIYKKLIEDKLVHEREEVPLGVGGPNSLTQSRMYTAPQ